MNSTDIIEVTSDEESSAVLPEAKDFDGYEFNIIGQSISTRQNFYMEELEGDVINDAIYSRDIAVSERLNVELIYMAESDRGLVARKVQNVVLADEEAYDLVITSISDGINSLISGGMLYDLKKVPYLTLDSELWNHSMLENMTMGGKLYLTTGAISAAYCVTPIVMAMNQQLADDYNIGDIYQTVLDGKWTVDLLHKLTADIAYDVDNNDIMDTNDFYGLIFEGTFGNALFNSSGTPSIENGKLVLDSERAVSVIQRLASYFGDRSIYLNDENNSKDFLSMFKNRKSLFIPFMISGIISSLRDMEDDFAIIPIPKYEESQDNYYTTCNTWLPSGVVVPKNCSEPERTGLIMETMAYYSEMYIKPAVYETTLRGKVARDDNSSVMLDIIYSNAYYDLVTAMNFNSSAELLRRCALGENDNFVSEYQKIKGIVQNSFDKIIDGVE